ncbi:hypothetical protein BGW38_008356 [Lunasporangiospora selenospora]|uniref:Crinkler effector protein N-terminal domain-containing protein n=1 Tax=Lunasporangiospora selenospora TaxID=979761 RepID=A0A9P6KFP3_9FUNG|nr:hypothetical protein BGW38_008356 [Lunasporangiospora selenospora]
MLNYKTLLCFVDGEPASNAFPILMESNEAVSDLQDRIKVQRPDAFANINAEQLILWNVSIPVTLETKHKPIILGEIESPTKLNPTDGFRHVVNWGLSRERIQILVQQSPSDTPVYNAKDFEVVVKYDSKIEEKEEEKEDNDFYYYSDDDDEEEEEEEEQEEEEEEEQGSDLRDLLKEAIASSSTKLTIHLRSSARSFTRWSFSDVCAEYQLPVSAYPDIEDLAPFIGILSTPLETDLQKSMLESLTYEVSSRAGIVNIVDANRATKSLLISPFLFAAARLFDGDFFLLNRQGLIGRRGHEAVDCLVTSRKDGEYISGVTIVKRGDFRNGYARNMVQLEAMLTLRERERKLKGKDKEPPRKHKSFGIVTDSEKWAFLECTQHEDKTVSFKASMLSDQIDYNADMDKDVESVFEKLAWLWSQMKNELLPTSPRIKRMKPNPI